MKTAGSKIKTQNRFQLQQIHRSAANESMMADDESQYDTDCGMETADAQLEQTTRMQRTSSAVRADTPPPDISIDLGTAAAADDHFGDHVEIHEQIQTTRSSLAVFITGNGRSIMNHCAKANVNFERDLQTAIGKTQNIYYNKKEDHLKVVCLNINQKTQLLGTKTIGKINILASLPRGKTRENIYRIPIRSVDPNGRT